MDRLKLVALDAEDLEVVSAHVQDAVLKVGDLKYLKKEQRFVLALNRFVWEREAGSGRRSSYERRRSVLHFERVRAARASRIRRDDPDAVLELLAAQFEERDPPSGVVTLTFAGGGALELEVECLEARLADLGPAWATTAKPSHPLDEPDEAGPRGA